MPDLLAWLRCHPWQADGLLALLLVVASSGQWQWQGQGSAVSHVAVTAFSVLLAATVVPRRRYPVAMFAVAAAIGAVQIALSVEPTGGPPSRSMPIIRGSACWSFPSTSRPSPRRNCSPGRLRASVTC
jgi:hypothetical protein